MSPHGGLQSRKKRSESNHQFVRDDTFTANHSANNRAVSAREKHRRHLASRAILCDLRVSAFQKSELIEPRTLSVYGKTNQLTEVDSSPHSAKPSRSFTRALPESRSRFPFRLLLTTILFEFFSQSLGKFGNQLRIILLT